MRIDRRGDHQKGTALIEYCVVCVALVTALFVPLPNIDTSLLNYFMDVLRQFQSHTTVLISMP